VGAEPPRSVDEAGVLPVLPGRGPWRVRLAESAGDVAASQRLRHLCFVEAAGGPARPGGRECDGLDDLCRHVLIEERETGRLVCSFRLLRLSDGGGIGQSYAAQFYDLGRLAGFDAPMMEVGRFCIRPDCRDPDVLRLAWGTLARMVDATGVEILFGCSSFAGTRAEVYAETFALLAQAHVAPARWAPGIRAPEVVRFGAGAGRVDRMRALAGMPPLLRTYLGMGGWVSDHAVVDRDLNTLHVFTGVEIRAIPPARARSLRAVAG
jgi:putative hemolysin